MSTRPRTHAQASAPIPAPTLRQVRPTLWRVLRSDGSMAGYIDHTTGRFEARRMMSSTRQVVGVGEFATIDDALLCFS